MKQIFSPAATKRDNFNDSRRARSVSETPAGQSKNKSSEDATWESGGGSLGGSHSDSRSLGAVSAALLCDRGRNAERSRAESKSHRRGIVVVSIFAAVVCRKSCSVPDYGRHRFTQVAGGRPSRRSCLKTAVRKFDHGIFSPAFSRWNNPIVQLVCNRPEEKRRQKSCGEPASGRTLLYEIKMCP
jgi:hypothetical protein